MPHGIPPTGPLPLWLCASPAEAQQLRVLVGQQVRDDDDGRTLYVWSVPLPSSPSTYRAWPSGNVDAIWHARDWLKENGVAGGPGY